MFGTYKQPDKLLLDGAPATKEDARKLTPQPRWPVACSTGWCSRDGDGCQKETETRAADGLGSASALATTAAVDAVREALPNGDVW